MNGAAKVCIMCLMKRVQHHLTPQELEGLRRISKVEGLSVAELIRRAVDAMLAKWPKRGRAI